MEPIAPKPAAPEFAAGQKYEAPQVGERSLASSPEVLPQDESKESQPQDPSNSGPAPTTLSVPQLPAPQVNPVLAQSVMNDNPLVAADEEVIEKEWVQKAKKVVEQTKGDPHAQEKEVSKLQADYIKKRYGKEIKLASE